MNSNQNSKIRLGGICRVKNGGEYFTYTCTQLSKLCDRVIVMDDHSTDKTVSFAKKFHNVSVISSPYSDYNEARDRQFCIDRIKELNPEWIVTLDADEVFEDKIYNMIDKLLNNENDPQALNYIFPLFNFWNDDKHWRSDGCQGNMIQGRMFKNLPNQIIYDFKDGSSLSGCTPWASQFNTRMVLCRIKHRGTLNLTDRNKKFEFYSKLYKEKGVSPLALGAWEEYYKKLYKKDKLAPEDYCRHIIDEEGLILHEWLEDNSISVNIMIKNDAKGLYNIVSMLDNIATEFVVVDTGSTDNTKKLATELGCKLIQTEWNHDFSSPRNLCLKYSTKPWVVRIDGDEEIPHSELMKLYMMSCAGEYTGYIFPIKNYLESPVGNANPKYFYSQTIRMFKRDERIRFNRAIHEEIDKSLASIPDKKIAFAPVSMNHYGYLKPKEVLNAKFDYYYRLGLKQIEMDPQDFYSWHNCAVHLKHVGKLDEAIEYYNKSLSLEPKAFLSLSGLAEIAMERKDLEGALEYYIKAFKVPNALKSPNFMNYCKERIALIKKDIYMAEFDRKKDNIDKELSEVK